ncbi:FkbM family methyltransferase [Bradyrhizobium sp. Tv2a-2]|uniref:FkbM family methyltransferase n=1 Tax=Bradyrhizobium sp. Tv2a-2 TaxID=113395 RepID=UPI000A064365|nr:FkbM family methyltransferase [Bradyrhizobium sp. Tv2a-2]
MIDIKTIHWHTLSPDYLGKSALVLDLGANYGLFASKITKELGCFCVAVEPSPIPFAGIREDANIRKINAAVGSAPGKMGFRIDNENGLASSLTDGDGDVLVDVKTLPQIMEDLNWRTVNLLKVDIEGAEIDMLESYSDDFLRSSIGQISIEFHDFCGITPADTVAKTIKRLERLGFCHVRMSLVGHQDTWLINRNLNRISYLQLMYARHVIRNWFGLKRVISRLLASMSRRL